MARTRDDLWPGRPPALPDEALSSWFSRLAAANGLRPGDLFAVVLPGGYRYPRDLDRFADDELLEQLAAVTQSQIDDLRMATFRRWVGRVFEHDDGLNKLVWLPPAGKEDYRRSFGLHFCPACLAEDSIPYFRLSWRLAFAVACPVHGTLLLDRCEWCGEPINPLKADQGNLTHCWSCNRDLRRANTIDVGPEDLNWQKSLLDVVDRGWGEFGRYGPLYSFAFLRVLGLLFRLLSSGKHAQPLRAWLTQEYPHLGPCPRTPRVREVEILNTRHRRELLRLAVHLISDWPTRFVEACSAIGLTSRHLLKTGRDYPFAYQQAVEWELTTQFRRMEAKEIESAIAVLQKKGIKPTYKALVNLTGVKAEAARDLVEPVAEQAPWGGGRYWKIDGVSPEVKAAARKAAHQVGESVGAWIEGLLRRELKL